MSSPLPSRGTGSAAGAPAGSSQAAPDRSATRPKAPVPDDPAAIEAAIREWQARLAATVDELTTRVSPAEVARRSKASAQQKLDAALRAEDGSLRIERLVAIIAALLALLGVRISRKRRRARRVASSE